MSKTRAASAPWNGSKPGRPGRQPKVAERRPSCIWPTYGDGPCGAPRKDGMAVCPEHAKILHGSAGHECAWPPCTQYAAFRSVCGYHEKVARGLLAPAR